MIDEDAHLRGALVFMLVALTVTAFGAGVHSPSEAGHVDPARIPR